MKVKREIDVQFPIIKKKDDLTCLLSKDIEFFCGTFSCDTCYFSVKVFKEVVNGSVSN